MKKVIAILSIALFLSSCMTKQYIVTNKTNKDIELFMNNSYVQTVKSTEQYSFKSELAFPTKILGKTKDGDVSHKATIKHDGSGENLIAFDAKNIIIEKQEKVLVSGPDELAIFLLLTDSDYKPSESMGFGYLKLESNEDNVDIYLDDQFIGKITNGTLNKKVPVGVHHLMAKKEFYMPNSINIEVKDKEVFQHIFSLQTVAGWSETKPGLSQTEQARGGLTIVTEKTDFIVYIEGVEKTPPFELKNMPAGKYNIRVVCPDFDKIIEVIVPYNDVEFIDLDELFTR